jgi:hypothetical protein
MKILKFNEDIELILKEMSNIEIKINTEKKSL